MSPDETERLIFEVLDGSADAKQRSDLAALLAVDPDALATYCRCCELDSALHRIAKGRGSLGTVASLAATGTEDRLGVRTPLLAAVAAVLLLGALLWLFRAPAVESLARISTSPDALYNALHSKEGPTPAGELVAGSALWLSQGSVELVFQNGVRSVIEAPAEWVMVDENRMDLRHGAAWFEVPPAAAGFQVFTPDLEVTDLGTEFGVLVEQGKNDQVHVFSGAVHARHRNAPATVPQIRLSAGMAATASPLRLLDLISVEPERFSVSIPAVLPYLRWSFASGGPQGWPAAGSHPDLSDAFARPIGTPEVLADGPDGSALRLAPDQQLTTDWPGVAGSRARSIAGWIRIPADVPDDQIPASLVFWGREGDNLSMMKWRFGLNLELRNEGGVKGALRTEFGNGYLVGSTDLRDGRWHHVASVFQGGNTSDNPRRILHFVDGVAEASSAAVHQLVETDSDSPVQFGGRGGRVDLADFIIVEGALTPGQVSALARKENFPPK